MFWWRHYPPSCILMWTVSEYAQRQMCCSGDEALKYNIIDSTRITLQGVKARVFILTLSHGWPNQERGCRLLVWSVDFVALRWLLRLRLSVGCVPEEFLSTWGEARHFAMFFLQAEHVLGAWT